MQGLSSSHSCCNGNHFFRFCSASFCFLIWFCLKTEMLLSSKLSIDGDTASSSLVAFIRARRFCCLSLLLFLIISCSVSVLRARRFCRISLHLFLVISCSVSVHSARRFCWLSLLLFLIISCSVSVLKACRFC